MFKGARETLWMRQVLSEKDWTLLKCQNPQTHHLHQVYHWEKGYRYDLECDPVMDTILFEVPLKWFLQSRPNRELSIITLTNSCHWSKTHFPAGRWSAVLFFGSGCVDWCVSYLGARLGAKVPQGKCVWMGLRGTGKPISWVSGLRGYVLWIVTNYTKAQLFPTALIYTSLLWQVLFIPTKIVSANWILLYCISFHVCIHIFRKYIGFFC